MVVLTLDSSVWDFLPIMNLSLNEGAQCLLSHFSFFSVKDLCVICKTVS